MLLATATLMAAVPYTAPDGDFTGNGQVDAVDLQCAILVFNQLAQAGNPPQSQCQTNESCVALLGAKSTCRATFGQIKICMPGCLSPEVTFGPNPEVPCLDPNAETSSCKGLVQKQHLDLNCDDQFNSTDINFLVSVITGKTGGPGTSDVDKDGRLNICDDDSDGDEVVDPDDCDPLDPAIGDCDDANPCTLDTCIDGVGCQSVPVEGNPCSDDNPGTTGDTCQADGSCLGQSDVHCGPLDGSTGTLGSLTLIGAVVVDTTAGTITAGGQVLVGPGAEGVSFVPQEGSANGFPAPDFAVFQFQDLAIAQGATVQVNGAKALALLAAGTLTVAGQLNVRGSAGTSGGTNQAGVSGGAGPGGWNGGGWQNIGCLPDNGLAVGPGAGGEGHCGSDGEKGGNGASGGGGGGGGGGTGGTGGAGGSHATAGGSGNAGESPSDGSSGLAPGTPGSGGAAGAANVAATGGASYGEEVLSILFGGTGGSSGGYGGFAGVGGWGVGNGGTGYGGNPGFSGGPGGGGGGGGAVLLCASGTLEVSASGIVDVRGGYGGGGGGSAMSDNGSTSLFGSGPIGGGGGGGRSGGGGGGGGGAGGAIFLTGSQIQIYGELNASGGGAGYAGWTGSGALGGNGKSGGGKGGKGGSGGKGGTGGKGGDGYIRLEAESIILEGPTSGVMTQSP